MSEPTPQILAPDVPVKTRKPDRRRARTRHAILEAAERLFADQGMEPTTVDEIAELTGLSVGTLYFHFGSKEGVLHALVGRVLDGALADLERARDTSSALDRVLRTGDLYFRFATEQPVAFRFVSASIPAPTTDASPEAAELSARINDQIASFVALVTIDLEQAMRDGEIATFPVDEALTFVWGSWNGVAGLVARDDRFGITPELGERALRRGRGALIIGLGGDPRRG